MNRFATKTIASKSEKVILMLEQNITHTHTHTHL